MREDPKPISTMRVVCALNIPKCYNRVNFGIFETSEAADDALQENIIGAKGCC